MVFDYYISLGFNCEISFRIRDYLRGKFDSFPFSWAYIDDFSGLVDALNNFDNLTNSSTTLKPNGMLQLNEFKMSFHLRQKVFTKTGEVDQNLLNEMTTELKSRLAHMIEKFKNVMQSQKRKLFVIKFRNNAECALHLPNIYEYLNKNCAPQSFEILVVCEEANKVEIPTTTPEHVFVETIKNFADESQTKTDGDLKGWHNAFNAMEVAFGGKAQKQQKPSKFAAFKSKVKQIGFFKTIGYAFKKLFKKN